MLALMQEPRRRRAKGVAVNGYVWEDIIIGVKIYVSNGLPDASATGLVWTPLAHVRRETG
ncbi:unnamed protein product [Leptidea sinapis]|uniref:Uncharacterized protein n=1 Tax=Leptidea sinapis TaxID=189913 RepID=A0A5E4PVE1_9NEOP|nr:unnamed protein product [Leptidea sinapis]